jgi:hypothetical protein
VCFHISFNILRIFYFYFSFFHFWVEHSKIWIAFIVFLGLETCYVHLFFKSIIKDLLQIIMLHVWEIEHIIFWYIRATTGKTVFSHHCMLRALEWLLINSRSLATKKVIIFCRYGSRKYLARYQRLISNNIKASFDLRNDYFIRKRNSYF